MWLVTTVLGRTLGGFHNMVALRMTKKTLIDVPTEVGSTPHWEGYGMAWLKGVYVYITWSQNTIVQYIVTPPSLEIFTETEKSTGS